MQEVNSDESKISISGRKVVLVIAKAGSTEEYWPRLLHSKQKQNNITVRSLSRCPVTPHVGALPFNGKLTKLDGVFAQQHRVEYALGHQARGETPIELTRNFCQGYQGHASVQADRDKGMYAMEETWLPSRRQAGVR